MRKPLLIMLPFAGGNSFSYREICNALGHKYEILCPEIPGRGSLATEKPFESIEDISDYVFEKSIKSLKLLSSYVIYGHSMGGLLTYSLLKKIEENNLPLPKHIVVSGKSAPSVTLNRYWHLLPSKEFWNNLIDMGGIPEELLSCEELKEYFENILRADFKAVETYEYKKPNRLSNVPITVLYGSEEPFEEEDLDNWKNETTKEVKFIKMDGKHFFIYDHTSEVAKIIESVFL